MAQSRKPWYAALVSCVVEYLGKRLNWSALGFAVALPFAFAWLVVGQMVSQFYESIGSFTKVGFFSFGYAFVAMFAINRTNKWLARIQGGLIFGLLVTLLALMIYYFRSISIQALIVILGVPITFGTGLGLGFGIILSLLAVRFSKKSKTVCPMDVRSLLSPCFSEALDGL